MLLVVGTCVEIGGILFTNMFSDKSINFLVACLKSKFLI